MTYCRAKSVRLVRKGESIAAKVGPMGYGQVKLDEDSYVIEMTDCETVIVPVAMIRRNRRYRSFKKKVRRGYTLEQIGLDLGRREWKRRRRLQAPE